MRNVVVLLFDNAELLDFCGPIEVFSVANDFCEPNEFEIVTTARESTVRAARNAMQVNVTHTLNECPAADILIVPGGIGTRRLLDDQDMLDWISEFARDAELVCSVCTGALLLAKVGLLRELSATTHAVGVEVLRELSPTSRVFPERRFVDNGKIITSAGISAGIDMSLHVVGRLLGQDIARMTAEHMEYDWVPLN